MKVLTNATRKAKRKTTERKDVETTIVADQGRKTTRQGSAEKDHLPQTVCLLTKRDSVTISWMYERKKRRVMVTRKVFERGRWTVIIEAVLTGNLTIMSVHRMSG